MNFYDRCEELARSKNISLNELGRRVGVSGPAITGWKNGSLPKLDIAMKVAEEFDVSIDYLATGKEKDLSQRDIELLKDFHSASEVFQQSILNLLQQVKEYK